MKIYGDIKDCKDESERKVYKIFDKSIYQKDIEAYFSFAIFNWKNYGIEWETDIILVGKAGIFVIEVKGGQVAVKDGEYYQYDKKIPSPPEQASKNRRKLKDLLIKNGIDKDVANEGGYGMLYVDTRWQDGNDPRTLGLVLDKSFQVEPLRLIVNLVSNYSAEKEKLNWKTKLLSAQDIEAIRSVLAPQSKVVSDISNTINESEKALIELSIEQLEVYKGLKDNPRVIVKGPPGTGKTMLAYQILKENEIAGNSALYICKNRALANYIQYLLNLEFGKNLKYTAASTIDSLSTKIIGTNIVTKNYDELAGLAAYIARETKKHEKYNIVIIDEAQDILTQNYCDLINEIITDGFEQGKWIVLMDPNQDMFGKLQADVFDVYIGSSNPVRYSLQKNYRNTVEIHHSAQILSNSIDGVPANNIRGLAPELIVFSIDSTSSKSQARLVNAEINKLIKNGIEPNDITILSFKSSRNSLAESGNLKLSAGVKLRHVNSVNWNNLDDNTIIYASIYEYKGLDNKVVLYTDIYDLNLEDESRIKYLVGATRARSHFIMFVTPKLNEYLTNEKFGNIAKKVFSSKKVPIENYRNLIETINKEYPKPNKYFKSVHRKVY